MLWLTLLVFLSLVYILYNRWSWIHSYWEFKGVAGPRPLPFIGNMLHNILGKKTFGELCAQWSREFKDEQFVGFYSFMKPFLLVNRFEYVETILVKEFSLFTDRLTTRTGKKNFSDKLLFLATGSTWKALRAKMAPIYTEQKLKGMANRMKLCCDNVLKHIDNNLSKNLATGDLNKAYITDVTARVVFGLESEEVLNPPSEFIKHSKQLFETSQVKFFDKIICFNFPWWASILQVPIIPNKQFIYFQKVLGDTFKCRRSEVKRNDVAQSLLELKEKGQVDVDARDGTQDERLTEDLEFTDELLTCQATAFLMPGYDALFSTLTFTLKELCQHLQSMNTLVQEIDTVIDQHKDFTYEALQDMKYLDMCLLEAMRLHPAFETISRYCLRNYSFDNGLQVEKGTMLVIPVLAIHMDPQEYPEPSSFRPERFSTPPKPGTYLAFGDGPRNCIAKRFAMLKMKMILARLLHRYQVRLCSSTETPQVSVEGCNQQFGMAAPAYSNVFFNLSKRPYS